MRYSHVDLTVEESDEIFEGGGALNTSCENLKLASGGVDVTLTHAYTSTSQRSQTTSRGFRAMIRGVARNAKYNKGFALWQFVRYAVAATYFWLGGTFLFGGNNIHVEPTYHLIGNLLGSIRVHGAILFLLAIWVASKPTFKMQTAYGLLATFFYSLLSMMLICGGWVLRKPDLTVPAWYALVGALSFILIVCGSLAKGGTAKNGGSRA